MNAHDIFITVCGILIAILAAWCMVAGAGVLGIAGFQSLSITDRPVPDPIVQEVYSRGIALDVPLPAAPSVVPQYRVITLYRYTGGTGTALSTKKAIPSVEEAPGLAEKALAAYGGLPAGAVLEKAEQNFLYQYNLATETQEAEFPQYTLVRYHQYVNGTRVMNADLSAELGESGELVGLHGLWATLEPAGETPIISAEEALEKLRAGDLLLQLQCSIAGSHIVRVERGYYIREGTREPQPPARVITPDTCIPVWVFSAAKPGAEGEPFPLFVNATRE